MQDLLGKFEIIVVGLEECVGGFLVGNLGGEGEGLGFEGEDF